MQWTFLPVQENSSYDIPLLLPVHLSLARQSEHFLQQPENQWSQVLDKKICRDVYKRQTQEEWKLRAMGTTIGCHTIVKKGAEGNDIKTYDLT